MKEDQSPQPEPAITHLCDADAQLLDILLYARRQNADTAPLPPDADRRLARLKPLLALLDQYAAEDEHIRDDTSNDTSDDLVRRTIARAHATRQQERFTEQLQMLAQPHSGFGFHWRKALSAAAIIILGLSLLLPALSQTRAKAIQQECENNLRAAGQAITQYANDHLGYLPRANARPGALWWDVGDPAHSNSAQLYVLVRQGYINPDRLDCPANPHAPVGLMTRQNRDWPSAQAVSYSYQNQYTAKPIRISQAPDLAVLADKNPLLISRVGHMMLDMQLPPEMPSRTHGGRGQNVLEINGSVAWTVRPTTHRPGERGNDNIWLMNGVKQYNGTESPVNANDSFLVP